MIILFDNFLPSIFAGHVVEVCPTTPHDEHGRDGHVDLLWISLPQLLQLLLLKLKSMFEKSIPDNELLFFYIVNLVTHLSTINS